MVDSRVFGVAGPPPYQTKLCNLVCAARQVSEACGCTHVVEVGVNSLSLCTRGEGGAVKLYFPIFANVMDSNFYRVGESPCVSQTLSGLTGGGGGHDCGCRPMCDEDKYEGEVTVSRWG